MGKLISPALQTGLVINKTKTPSTAPMTSVRRGKRCKDGLLRLRQYSPLAKAVFRDMRDEISGETGASMARNGKLTLSGIKLGRDGLSRFLFSFLQLYGVRLVAVRGGALLNS